MMKKFTILLILTFILGLTPTNFSEAAGLAIRLKGKILLQVESKGEAWYVNPDNEKRYYLGRPADAFQVMRDLGLGISNKDFGSFNGYAPRRLSGKILLKVEDSGKAYYVNPVDFKMHYLGKPSDAFQIMRSLGLGITNNDLNKIIPIEGSGAVVENQDNNIKDTSVITETDRQNLQKLINSTPKVNKTIYLTDYRDNKYSVSIDIPLDYYLYYKNKPHDMGNSFENITAFITPDDYFINLLLQKIDDFNMDAIANQTPMIINSLEEIIQSNYYIEDWHSGFDEYPKYPIETIFEGNGDCEDLSFLMATLLKSTSDNIYYGIRAPYYSVALIRFTDHLGVGLTYEDSETKTAAENFTYIHSVLPSVNGYYEHNNKKYFYIESTNTQFDFGEIPTELKNQKVFVYPLTYNKPQI